MRCVHFYGYLLKQIKDCSRHGHFSYHLVGLCSYLFVLADVLALLVWTCFCVSTPSFLFISFSSCLVAYVWITLGFSHCSVMDGVSLIGAYTDVLYTSLHFMTTTESSRCPLFHQGNKEHSATNPCRVHGLIKAFG